MNFIRRLRLIEKFSTFQTRTTNLVANGSYEKYTISAKYLKIILLGQKKPTGAWDVNPL